MKHESQGDETMKTTKRIEVDLYGAIGTGSTKTEAKAQAEAKIATAFSDAWNYAPSMQRFPKGEVGTVYRTLEGWQYIVLWPTHEHTDCSTIDPKPTKQDAKIAMRRHIAQDYWESDDEGVSILFSYDDEGIRQQRAYAKFQRTYRQLRAEGKTDVEAHYEACQMMYA
jgi:hypothetical protein